MSNSIEHEFGEICPTSGVPINALPIWAASAQEHLASVYTKFVVQPTGATLVELTEAATDFADARQCIAFAADRARRKQGL